MTRDVDDFLAEADDVIDDWESSPDAASWCADGSHEHDSDGHYYLSRPHPWDALEAWFARIEDQLPVLIYSAERVEPFPAAASTAVAVRRALEQLHHLAAPPVAAPEPTVTIDVASQCVSRGAGASFVLFDEAQLFVAPVGTPLPSTSGCDRAASSPATDDARRPVPRRSGVDAQQSPFGPQRRGPS